MSIEGPEDFEDSKRAGRAVAEARDAMAEAVAPGVVITQGEPIVLTASGVLN